MKTMLRQEWQRFVDAFKQLDKQTMFVLTLAGFLIVIQFNLGSRSFFRKEIAPFLFDDMWHGLASWGWWFTIQGITGFVVPVLCLIFIFKRKPSEIGLGLGDWKLASILALCYLPLVGIGTWILSDSASFQSHYPHYNPAAYDWTAFFIYELLFLFYWVGWEYLWRGFMLFGISHTFGMQAILFRWSRLQRCMLINRCQRPCCLLWVVLRLAPSSGDAARSGLPCLSMLRKCLF